MAMSILCIEEKKEAIHKSMSVRYHNDGAT